MVMGLESRDVRYLLLACSRGAFTTPYKLFPRSLHVLILSILKLDDTITDSPRTVAVRSKGPLTATIIHLISQWTSNVGHKPSQASARTPCPQRPFSYSEMPFPASRFKKSSRASPVTLACTRSPLQGLSDSTRHRRPTTCVTCPLTLQLAVPVTLIVLRISSFRIVSLREFPDIALSIACCGSGCV